MYWIMMMIHLYSHWWPFSANRNNKLICSWVHLMSGILDIYDIMHSVVELNKHNRIKNMYSQVCVFFVTEIPVEREKVCFYKHYIHIQYVTCAACHSPRSLMCRSLSDLQPCQWLLVLMCWAAVEPEPMTNAVTHGQDEGIWTSMLIHLCSF